MRFSAVSFQCENTWQEPVASMHSGKIIWVLPPRLQQFSIAKKSSSLCESQFQTTVQAKGNEIQTANLKLLDEGVTAREGEKVPLSVKDSSRFGGKHCGRC